MTRRWRLGLVRAAATQGYSKQARTRRRCDGSGSVAMRGLLAVWRCDNSAARPWQHQRRQCEAGQQGAGPTARCGRPRPSPGGPTNPAWWHRMTARDVAMCAAWGGSAVTAHTAPTNPRHVTSTNFKALITTKPLLLNLNRLHYTQDGIWNY